MIAASRAARLGRPILAAGWLTFAAGVAWAAEGGSAHPWQDLLWRAVNFLVLAGVIWWFARKPIASMFRGAAREGKEALDAHRERARGAEAELAEQRRRIDDLQAELQRMTAATSDEARSEHERLLAEARHQAERIRTAVGMQVEHEFNKARKELQVELARATVQLAETMIRQRTDDAGRRRLAGQAIERLGAGS